MLFSFGTLFGNSALANKLSDLEEQEKELEQKDTEVDQQLDSAELEIQEIEGKVDSMNAELQALDNEIYQTEIDITAKDQEIKEKDAEITNLTSEIEVLADKIQKRDALLADRVRALQSTGGTVSYLDVLLGASSFTDFIGRVSAVTKILDADKSILEEHKKDKETLQSNKEKLEIEKTEIEKLKSDLESKKGNLEQQKSEKDKIMVALRAEMEAKEEYFLDLQEEQELIAAQKAAIQKAKEREKQRIEEEKRRAEEAAKKAAEQAAQNGGGNAGNAAPPAVAPSGGGKFIRPASGRITSEFTNRIHPIYGYYERHNGIDMANSTGTPVYASAGGTVIKSGYNPSFGNVIFISHYMDGKVYTTVYAHLSKLRVSFGEEVQQGQLIGDIGSTGDSTGPHLHFQIHEGEYSSSTAVNPRKYVNF